MKKFISKEEVLEANHTGFYHINDLNGDLIIGFKTEGSICNDFFYYGAGVVMKAIYDDIVKGLYLLEDEANKEKESVEIGTSATPEQSNNETISVQSIIELINAIKK